MTKLDGCWKFNETVHCYLLTCPEMNQILYLDDICRFCLGNKNSDGAKYLFKIEESTKMKFEAVSGINVAT